MKSKFILFFLVLSISTIAQTNIGIGLVSIKFDDKTVLNLYSAITDKQPVKTIRIFNDKAINSWNIQNLEKEQKWLNPEILKLDYDLFVFRCEQKEIGWFKIIVDKKSGKSLWIKMSKITEFSDWNKFLQEMFSVQRLSKNNQIHKFPNDGSEIIKFVGEDCFQVKSMKGDWIEIFTSECEDSQSEIKSGWIKWKKGNELLIEYFPLS